MRRQREKEGERESSGYEMPWAAWAVDLREVSTVVLPLHECSRMSARCQLATTMTQDPGVFISILAATEKPCVPICRQRGTLQPALPPSPPPPGTEWPACEVSTLGLGLESALPLSEEDAGLIRVSGGPEKP